MKKISLLFLIFAVLGYSPQTTYADQDIKVMVRQEKATLNYQAIEDGKLLVSVLGPDDEPVRGLTPQDFVVGSGIQRAEVISAAPLETTEEIALNVVLVVDNSFSMKERRAVAPLLEAMDEFFKTVRPIDNIHLVVFDEHPVPQLELQGLHARTFNSGDAAELRNFLKESLDDRSTGKTYLYEAMAAGLDIIRGMPEQDNKFMVVFSDGEDFNSRIANVFIDEQAQGLKNLEVYCVDYMPGPKLDRFLTSFAKTHSGRIWKATSAAELLPIFQAFTTALRYRYVVTYRMLDPLAAEPAGLNFDILTMVDGAPIGNALFFETGQSDIPADYVLFKDTAEAASFNADSPTTARERYLNILNVVGQNLSRNPDVLVKIVGCNSNSGVEAANLDLSRRRAEAVKAYLQEIWGIQGLRMGIEARNLPDDATSMNLVGARPENQRVEIIYDSDKMQAAAPGDFIAETGGRRELKVRTHLFAEAGVSDWQLTIFGDDQPFKSLTGRGDMPPDQLFSLQDLDKARLSKFGAIAVQARITDSAGKTYETTKLTIPVTVSFEKWDDAIVRAPHGSITLEPAEVTIEELTTIDSSPFLNYIYFAGGESEIPPRYALLKSQTEAANFDENNLKDTM
jgi:outer membrane protein OmpA-like peptidoglycan-associated protein